MISEPTQSSRLFLILGTMLVLTAPQGPQAWAGENRKTALDFDDEVVEGVNKKPLDSLQQLSEKNAKSGLHLYRKRTHFKPETQELVREMRVAQ